MQPPRMTAAERTREAREAAVRRRRLSARLGSVGVLVLFLSGIGVILATDYASYLLAVMVGAIVLILAAFLMVRTPIDELLKTDE